MSAVVAEGGRDEEQWGRPRACTLQPDPPAGSSGYLWGSCPALLADISFSCLVCCWRLLPHTPAGARGSETSWSGSGRHCSWPPMPPCHASRSRTTFFFFLRGDLHPWPWWLFPSGSVSQRLAVSSLAGGQPQGSAPAWGSSAATAQGTGRGPAETAAVQRLLPACCGTRPCIAEPILRLQMSNIPLASCTWGYQLAHPSCRLPVLRHSRV